MAQSARAGFADGDRFAYERRRAFEIYLRFNCKSEARLNDNVSVMRRCAWADSWAVGAEAVGMNQHAAAFGAARFGEADEFIDQAADGFTRFDPSDDALKTFNRDVRCLPVCVGILAAD